MKRLGILFLFALSSVFSFGQGTVRGKITDGNGETIIGATIMLKSNMSFGTITDLDGNFSLKINDSTAQTLIISAIGLQKIEQIVHPVNGEVIIRNVVLLSSAQTVKEVQITAKAVRAQEYYVEKMKQNSATTLDYISSETMKKTGDASVVNAVARVSGVSTNAGFITVRGIGDRYVKTAINGSVIPTLDPFTNNIKLDMFPSSLVDNVLITKTASPDLPGDWAGAYLSVETKDYPEKLSVNAETSVGYNNRTTFKDVLTSDRSATDWLGYDNGFRNYDHNSFVSAIPAPDNYQEYAALGLGSYFSSLGITSSNWGQSPDTYNRLGLVQLGLLAPAQFNDIDAVQNARSLYQNGAYKSEAFKTINAGVANTGQSFPDNWNPVVRQAPLNFSQSFSIGNQTSLFGKPLGFLAGYRYGSTITYDPNSTANRPRYDRSIESALKQQASQETNGWSALMNVAYKLTPNHSVSLMFMPNLTGVNKVRKSTDAGDPNDLVITPAQFYEQRKQLVYQYKSEHYFPSIKLKSELNVSYTNGKSSAPDFKALSYTKSDLNTNYQIGPTVGNGIHRYYRYLSDNLFDSRLSFELPLKNAAQVGTRKIKFGGAYQRNDKKSDQYDYSLYTGANLKPLMNDDLNAYFSLDKFGIRYDAFEWYYNLNASAANHLFGRSSVTAGFLMLDYSFNPSLRFCGGLRVEKADIFTDVFKYDSLGYAPNDERRNYAIGSPLANPGALNELSYLPSANLIYKIKADEAAPVNLRLNYSRTVARPSIRELSDVSVFDYEFRTFVFGNSDLKMVQISNYDLRLEAYFKSNDYLSASFFYKDLKDHIELIQYIGYTWQNVDKSNVKGIELEGRKALAKHFDFRANITFVKSQTTYVRNTILISNGVKQYFPVNTVTRTMYGQAPYVVNGILTYTADSLGLSVAFSYNVQGPRLVIASLSTDIPDVYELQRHLTDIKITKSLAKHFSASLTVRDLLNTPIRRSYKYPEGFTLDYDKYTYGTNYVFGISYKL